MQKCNKKVDILGWRFFSRFLAKIRAFWLKFALFGVEKSGHTGCVGIFLLVLVGLGGACASLPEEEALKEGAASARAGSALVLFF